MFGSLSAANASTGLPGSAIEFNGTGLSAPLEVFVDDDEEDIVGSCTVSSSTSAICTVPLKIKPGQSVLQV